MTIQFICQGALNRSPMAAAYAMKYFAEQGNPIAARAAAPDCSESIGQPLPEPVKRIIRSLGTMDADAYRAEALSEASGKADYFVFLDEGIPTERWMLYKEGRSRAAMLPVSDPALTGDYERTFDEIRDKVRLLYLLMEEDGWLN